MLFQHFQQSLLRGSADPFFWEGYPDLRRLDPAWHWLPNGFGMVIFSVVIFLLSFLKILCMIVVSSRNNRFNTASTPWLSLSFR